jgi:hypothetical protein
MTTCLIETKNQYGKDEVVYPACKTSHLLAKIARQTTLTPATRKYAKQLGYTFEEPAKQL